MNLRFISLIGFAFFIGLFLSSCSPGQTLEPTFTTSPTITATVILAQTVIPTPEPTATPKATPTPSLLQGHLIGLASAPDIITDASGLHITLPDSSRVIDIATSDVEKQIFFDSEYNIYKIYDVNGNISAEYDPGQGKEGDADYAPATGWMDLQKLAKDLHCHYGIGDACLNKDYEDANAVWFEFSSTGILRYKEITDATGKPLGRVLIAAVASRDKDKNPISVWVLVQVENYSNLGVNSYNNGVAGVNLIDSGKINDAVNIFPIKQWQEWMSKNTSYAFGCNQDGQSFSDFLTGETDTIVKTDIANFIKSGGKEIPSRGIILVSVSVGKPIKLP